MSRWHREGCRGPVVEVSRSIPSCKSCGGEFSLAEAIALQELAVGADSCLSVPEDEPYGQMNLWWPPCLQYTKTAQYTQLHDIWAGQDEREQAQGSRSHIPQPTIRAEVYGETLPEGDFRLACLYASQDSSDPLHLDLETYRHSHAPDYETASYVWGGEAGDRAPRCPVFIGEYWDVFLQTNNCCELLRFARPTRGVRLIWVDAVCINQENLAERSIQVAMMRRIYSDCLQCLVYLGPDVVQWHGTRLPGRQGLHELERPSLERLLEERRYFSRLWVIQEVILSPRIIIPIDDTVYWADNTTNARVQENSSTTWDWDATRAPWLQDMSQRRLSIQTACESLLLTRHAHCTDPRDRLFGMLGLLAAKTGSEASLQPNYALSSQHMWLGFFAYSLVKDAAVWLLYNAAGHAARASAPSWAPSWNQAAMWSNLYCPDLNTDNVARKILESRPSRDGVPFDIASGGEQDISVDAHTGTLLGVRVMLLFTFLAKPTVVERLEGFTLFRSHSADEGIVEMACSEPLDRIIQPCTDSLFMLKIQSSIVFLVLRDVESTPLVKAYGHWAGDYVVVSKPSRYRLVAACPALFCRSIRFVRRMPTLEHTLNAVREKLNEELHSLVIFAPLVYDGWGLLDLCWSPCDPGHSRSEEDREKFFRGYLACLPRNCLRVETESQTHIVLRFEDNSNLMAASLNGWLKSVFAIWCKTLATEELFEGSGANPYVDWEWSLQGDKWQSFANWRCETFWESVFMGEGSSDFERRRSGTWDFHEIPHLKTGRHAGQVYLRAPIEAIVESYRFARCFSFDNLRIDVQQIKDVLGIKSVDELRSVLSDTVKDWSSFKYQEFSSGGSGRDGCAIYGQTWTVGIS